jgi:hypothetical protein
VFSVEKSYIVTGCRQWQTEWFRTRAQHIAAEVCAITARDAGLMSAPAGATSGNKRDADDPGDKTAAAIARGQ